MSQYFIRSNEGRQQEIFAGVQIRAVGGDELTVSVVQLEPHSVVEEHEHPHEQMGLLLEGELTFTIGEETRTLQAGDIWRIPGGVRHRCQAGDKPARAIDVFTPRRDDYC